MHPDSGYDDSFVYRIDTQTFAIDQVIGVGSVPKYVAVTPDDSTVLVTNWCTWDMSIIDAASATEVARVPIGRYPRGVVVSPDGATAMPFTPTGKPDIGSGPGLNSLSFDHITTEPSAGS